MILQQHLPESGILLRTIGAYWLKRRVVPPVLFRTNYYSIEIPHGVTAISLTYHPHHAKLQVLPTVGTVSFGIKVHVVYTLHVQMLRHSLAPAVNNFLQNLFFFGSRTEIQGLKKTLWKVHVQHWLLPNYIHCTREWRSVISKNNIHV